MNGYTTQKKDTPIATSVQYAFGNFLMSEHLMMSPVFLCIPETFGSPHLSNMQSKTPAKKENNVTKNAVERTSKCEQGFNSYRTTGQLCSLLPVLQCLS